MTVVLLTNHTKAVPALASRARARAREHFGMEAIGRIPEITKEITLVETAEMGLAAGLVFVVVALFAYFMVTILAVLLVRPRLLERVRLSIGWVPLDGCTVRSVRCAECSR
jgi:hypothetical protein